MAERSSARVLLSIPNGGSAGSVLRTGLVKRVLDAHPDVIVTLASPLVNDPAFANEFADPRVQLEDLPRHVPSGLEGRLVGLMQAAYLTSEVTESVRIRFAEARANKTMRWMRTKRLLTRTLLPSMTQPNSRYAWSDRLIAHSATEQLFDRIQPALYIASSPGLIFSEIPLLRTAARRGVRSMAVDPSWDNFTNKLLPVRRVDRLIVWNDVMKQQAIDFHGYAPDNVRVAGPPQWDRYFQPGVGATREAFFRRIGADPFRKLVTLTTTPRPLYAHHDHVLRVLIEAMRSEAWPLKAQVLVRLHPRDDTAAYDAFRNVPDVIVEKPFRSTVTSADGLDVDVTSDSQQHLADTMRHSDVVVNVASTIAIEAAIFDTPVVNIAFDGETASPFERSARRYYRFTHYQNITRHDAVRVARTPADLIADIGRYLADPALDRDGRRRVVGEQVQFLDGRSAERVGQFVADELADVSGLSVRATSSRAPSVITMCGIAGFVSLNGVPADRSRVDAMVRTLRHRGPDDAGCVVDGGAAIGAARLSVIDVAGGHQPMTVDGITVAQNGEIYNFVELRERLQRDGRVFRTSSDTEVIAHLYATEGLRAFERLRGMFAIAIWDGPRRQLVLARDRAGKKPLYWLEHGGDLLFASEAKAILAAVDRVPGVDAAALVEFFAFGYVAGERAVFSGMRRLTPGSTLVVQLPGGGMQSEPFWKWPDPPEAAAMSEGEAVEQLRGVIDEAVRIRLRSDVPLGAFLSGGMDSAAVLSLMTKHSSAPVKTFTIGFGDAEYDELNDARETAAHFGADHHEEIVTPDCVHVAETLAHYYDEPFADASAVPTFYVARLARQHVTVCLTGDGGDELFAGYTPYADALARVGSASTEAWRALVRAGAQYVPVHARGKGRLSTMALGPEAWFVWRRTVFPDYLLRAVVDPDVQRAAGFLPEQQAVEDLRRGSGSLLSRLQRWDQRHYLPDDILVKVDRATMAHSLEARCPLLDHQVIELAARQPASRHGDASATKRLFRRVIEPWVPADVLRRPKRGFGVPLRRWFQESLLGWARDILSDPRTRQRGWTRSAEVATLLRQHEEGSRDHAKRIWALVCLELWAREHVDRAGSRERACA